MLSLAFIMLLFGSTHLSSMHKDKRQQAVNSALSVALQQQQNEAANGGTRIVTPPTSVIAKDPSIVAAPHVTDSAVSNDALRQYVGAEFRSYLSSHPAQHQAINYPQLKSFIVHRVQATFRTTSPSATPTRSAGASATTSPTLSASASAANTAQVDYAALDVFINQQIASYELAHPAPSGPPGAKGDQGDPGPACGAGYHLVQHAADDGGSVELCSSAASSVANDTPTSG